MAVMCNLAAVFPISFKNRLTNFGRRWSSLVVLLAVLAGTSEARAGLVAYSFTGQVSSVLLGSSSGVIKSKFGLTFNLGDAVRGSFMYDTSSAVAASTATSAHYLQHYPGGFQLFVGPHLFLVSDYTISVVNNTGSFNDLFIVQFSTFSSSTPTNPGPISVNGNDLSEGRFQLRLSFPSTTWAATTIPTNEVILGYTSGQGNVSGHASLTSVLFSTTSLVTIAVPEPGTFATVVSSGLILVTTASRSRRKRLP